MAHKETSSLYVLILSMLLVAPNLSIENIKGFGEAGKLSMKLPSFLLAPLMKAEAKVSSTNFSYDDSETYDEIPQPEKPKKEPTKTMDPAAAFLEQKVMNIELRKQMDDLKKEHAKALKELQDQNAKLTAELNSAKESLKASDSLKEQVKSFEDKNKNLAEEIKACKNVASQKEEGLIQKNAQLKDAEKTINELKEKIEGFFKKFEDYKDQMKDVKSLSQDYEKLKKENAELKAQKPQVADCRKVEEDLLKSRRQVEDLKTEIEELKKKASSPNVDVAALQKQLKDLERGYIECKRNLNYLMVEDRRRNKDVIEPPRIIKSSIEVISKDGNSKQGLIVGSTVN
jgi:DNA repair exonuclease SbcCD ATPase subunit